VTITDDVQNKVFKDQSIKHRAKVRDLISASLGTDLPVRFSFRRFNRKAVQVNKDTVKISVFKEVEDDSGNVTRTQIVTDDDNISWLETGTEAEYYLDAQYLEEPCTLEVVLSWQNGSTPRSARQWSIFYRAEDFLYDYLALSDDEKQLCQSVMNRFWALFDNHYGQGLVNLTEEVQTNFNLDKVTRAMRIACSKINMFGYSTLDFYIGEGAGTPFPAQWYVLLENQTIVELMKQFVYGYQEVPILNGIQGVAYADRSRYADAWRQSVKEMEADIEAMKPAFIRDNLNLTGSSILVGGGYYGAGAGSFLSNKTLIALRSGAFLGSYLNVNTVVNTNF
jgi:hypothetical protein